MQTGEREWNPLKTYMHSSLSHTHTHTAQALLHHPLLPYSSAPTTPLSLSRSLSHTHTLSLALKLHALLILLTFKLIDTLNTLHCHESRTSL